MNRTWIEARPILSYTDGSVSLSMVRRKGGKLMSVNLMQGATGDPLRNRYQILETDSGLQISESRVMLFDVMEAYDTGNSIYQISQTFNLSPLQVQIAVDFIEAHRAALEPEYAKAIQLRTEREKHYRRLAEERWERIARLPMTPQRAAVYALLDKYRAAATGETNAVYPQ